MPEADTNQIPVDGNSQLLLRTLYDEQSRLRAELDRLRQGQDQLKSQIEKKPADDSKKDEGEKQDGKNEEQPKKDEQQKEPAKEKGERWAKAHPIGVILIVVALVAVLIGSYFLSRYLSSYENTDDAQVDGHTDPISARINGFVVAAYVENTHRVKKGQVIVDLDPRDYEVALAQARGNLAQAEANVRAQMPNVPITQTTQSTQVATSDLGVQGAAASLAAGEQTYQSALADLQQAEANAANAAAEEARYRALAAKQEVSREIYDQRATDARAQAALVKARAATADAALKNVTQAQSSLAQSQKRLEEAQHNLPRQVAIQSATLSTRQASIIAAKAQVDQALLNLTYCKVIAPEDGIVGDKSIQVGAQVAPGQEMLAITQTNDIWVTANFKETQIRNMRPGQSVTIHVDALSQDFDGFIEALPGATGATYSLLPPENATGNYVKVVQRLPIRIRFKANQPHAERLAPGMSVEPKVWVN